MHALKQVRKVAAVVLVSLASITLTSCSTLAVNSDVFTDRPCTDPYIYGGAIADTALFFYGVINIPKEPIGGLLLVTYSAIDFPFSLAADTIVLPITVYKTFSRC